MLRDDLTPVLADFGISKVGPKWHDAASSQSLSDTTGIGSAGYMAPEISDADGKPRHSKQSDVYALGVVILQMVTRRCARSTMFDVIVH